MGSNYEKEKLENAYGKGVEQAKNEGVFGEMARLAADIVAPTFGNKEAESRKAGYDDYKSGKVK